MAQEVSNACLATIASFSRHAHSVYIVVKRDVNKGIALDDLVDHVVHQGDEPTSKCINDILDSIDERWLLLLRAGEQIDIDEFQRVVELTNADPGILPAAIALRIESVNDSPIGQHDQFHYYRELRLVQTGYGVYFSGDTIPTINAEFPKDVEILWTDIVIRQNELLELPSLGDATVLTPYEKYRYAELSCRANDWQTANALVRERNGRIPLIEPMLSALSIHICTKKQGDGNSALAICLEEKERRQSSTTQTFFMEGVVRQKQDDLRRAIGCYQVAIDDDDGMAGFGYSSKAISSYWAPHNLALAAFELGDLRRAESIWKVLVVETIGFRSAYLAYFDLLRRDGRSSEIPVFCHAHSKCFRPGDIETVFAQLAEQKQEVSRARRHLEAALRTSPSNEFALFQACGFFRRQAMENEYQVALAELGRWWAGMNLQLLYDADVLRDLCLHVELPNVRSEIEQRIEFLVNPESRAAFLTYLVELPL